MFKIGDYARLAGVSVRTLHHYEDLGPLRPAGTSEGGTRYYAPGQLASLRRILALKFLGCTLQEIRTVFHERPEEPYLPLLHRKRQELQARRDVLDAQLAGLNAEIEKEQRMTEYTVQLKPVPALRALTARGSAPDYRHVTAPMNKLFEVVCAEHVAQQLLDSGWSVVTWRGGGYQSEDTIELEVSLPVFTDIHPPTQSGVTLTESAEMMVASTLHLGSYERFGEAYGALLAWMNRHGYAPAGPVREVYLRFSSNEAEQISELQIPVVKN